MEKQSKTKQKILKCLPFVLATAWALVLANLIVMSLMSLRED